MSKRDSGKKILIPTPSAGKDRQNGVPRKEKQLTNNSKQDVVIKDRNKKHADILDDLGISYFELDLDGNFTLVNNILCKLLGYSRKKLLGASYTSFAKPDNIELMKGIYQEIYRTGKPKTAVTSEVIKKDGSHLILTQSLSLMKSPSGKKVIGFRVVARDITERVRSEQLFKETAEKYQTILETMEEGYTESDLQGNYTFVSDAVCRHLGYEHDEVIGMNFRKFYSPDEARHLKTVYKRVYETGKSEFLIDAEATRKDGSLLVLQTNAALLRDSSGKPVGFSNLARDITERKKTEEIYRTILETMEEGLFETDLRGNYTFVNDAACRLMGYARDEMIGKNFRMCHTTETISELKEFYSRMYETGKNEKLLDYEAIRKEGSIRIHQANVAIIRDRAGVITGFRSLVRDITEYKKAQEALHHSEEKYRTILETMAEGYIENDLNGNFTFVNDAVCKLLGYSRNELIGMNYRKIHSPNTVQYVNQVFRQMYKTGSPVLLMDYDVISRDGSISTYQANAAPLFDHTGQITGFYTLARNVTERRKAEEDLRKSEERYRTILEIMEESYAEYDLAGTITFVNDAACSLLGYDRDELIGMNYQKYHTPEVAKYVKEIFNKIYKTGKPQFLIDYEVICKDGSSRICQMNSALMLNKSGEPAGFRILARDITERKKAEMERTKIEEQLKQAQKMESVGRLAGGVAHDFNNMITVILGNVELIKSRLPQENPLISNMLEIEKAAGRSRDLTRQLLAFSRKAIIAPRPVELNEMIVVTEKTILRLIGEDIDLKFYPGKDLWKIKVDPSQMEHILINLAVNARDAMPQGGKLTIETENIHLNEDYCKTHAGFIPGYFVLLGVSDNGIGMDRNTLQQIFEPFFTTKETGKGTGLGLAMVYGIVKQNNGFINVYSESGKGTSFKIYIPRSAEEQIVEEATEEPMATSATGTVLLVEDDEMVRTMTAEMLEAIGYKTLSTASPLEALSFFEKSDTHIDLVITDVVMPGMSGREMAERIGAIRPGVRVLFMSGYTANVIAHQGVLDEGVYFIQKPFSMSDLAQKARIAINGK